MPDAAVIDTGGGGGGGIVETVKANPLLAAGAVGLVVGVFVLLRRQSGGSAASSADADTLSPASNIALGQIAYDVKEGFGQAGLQRREQYDAITALLNGLGASVGTIGGQLDTVATNTAAIPESFDRIEGGIGSLADLAQFNEYVRRGYTFEEYGGPGGFFEAAQAARRGQPWNPPVSADSLGASHDLDPVGVPAA